MPDSSEPSITVERFTWVQDFAARLLDLGAPASSEQLLALGENLFEKNKRLNPVTVAETVWSNWPTESGA